MNLNQLLKKVNNELQKDSKVDSSIQIKRIVVDSRTVDKNTLFVAIKGSIADGHLFINSAVKNGAAAIIGDEQLNDFKDTNGKKIPYIQVKNSRKVLPLLISYFHNEPSKSFNLIGITGTNGKTTISYLLDEIFKAAGKVSGIIGTTGYRLHKESIEAISLTTPDPVTLHEIFAKMMQMNHDYVAMEVSSHSLEQFRVEGCDFNIKIFTNLTRDHLDYHGDMENYFQAKRRLFTGFNESALLQSKNCVLNLDDKAGVRLAEELGDKALTYSVSNKKSDVHTLHYEADLTGIKGKIHTPDKTFNFSSYLIGYFNISNILAAVSAAILLNIPITAIIKGIKNCNHVNGRLEKVSGFLKNNDPSVFIDYAHTPEALRSVLKTVNSMCKGKVITVFGCGGDRDKGKRPIMGEAVAENSDIAIITSDNPRTEDPLKIIEDILPGIKKHFGNNIKINKNYSKSFFVEKDRKKAIIKAIKLADKQDVVIIAGKGHEDYQILGTEKIHFSDHEIVHETFKYYELKAEEI